MLSIFQQHPKNRRAIALQVKEDAGWKCEVCGKECRRPGEVFDTQSRTLTLAYRNHNQLDYKRENLVAMCVLCHLSHDYIRGRRCKLLENFERKNHGQMMLFPQNSSLELLE